MLSALWLLTVVCILSTAGTLTAHWMLPILVTGKAPILPTDFKTKPDASANNESMSELPTLATYAPIWKLQLRPVVKTVAPAAPPKSASSPPPPSKPFTAKLTGTIIEDKHSMALFTTKTGEIQFVTIGQMIEDAKLVQIQPQEVIIDHNGKTLTIELSKPTTTAGKRIRSQRTAPYNRRRPIR